MFNSAKRLSYQYQIVSDGYKCRSDVTIRIGCVVCNHGDPMAIQGHTTWRIGMCEVAQSEEGKVEFWTAANKYGTKGFAAAVPCERRTDDVWLKKGCIFSGWVSE